MHRKLLTVVATWAVLMSVAATPSTAVVGGSDAAPGEFPSVAEIYLGAVFGCTGTLIDVYICSNKSLEGENIPVSKAVVSPEYFGLLNSRNDLTILTLSRPSSHAPTPVAAAGERSIWEPGDLETIAGWGNTSADGEEYPDTLQKAQVPITTDAYCESRYSEDEGWDFDPETMVCAGYPEGGIDTCQGDSGGPLFGRAADGSRRVVGVTSWGNGCAQEGYPGVYARVADTKLREWVASEAPNGVASSSSTTTTDPGTGGGKTKKSPRPKKTRG